MSHHMQPVLAAVVGEGPGNPVIVAEFADRWRPQSYRKRASASWLRKLRGEGVTHVAVEVAPGRSADFTIAELLSTR